MMKHIATDGKEHAIIVTLQDVSNLLMWLQQAEGGEALMDAQADLAKVWLEISDAQKMDKSAGVPAEGAPTEHDATVAAEGKDGLGRDDALGSVRSMHEVLQAAQSEGDKQR